MSLTKSAVVIVKLSIKSDLFDKAIEFIKERIVETRAFEGCQKWEIAASRQEVRRLEASRGREPPRYLGEGLDLGLIPSKQQVSEEVALCAAESVRGHRN